MGKNILLGVVLASVAFLVFKYAYAPRTNTAQTGAVSLPLAKYAYDELGKTTFNGSEITIGRELSSTDEIASRMFYFSVEGRKVSGLMNVPAKAGKYPLVVLVRGYVDPGNYQPGVGSSHAGETLARHGYITVAPDFLGYAQSDKAVVDGMEDRFLTYVTVLNLFNAAKNINVPLSDAGLEARFDGVHTGLWGHSNGGQIALSVLEISGGKYPTVLWAPVSKPFPYSILYYTDDIPDHGKALRKLVSQFEEQYDAEKYSLTNYLSRIEAPLQIHQGGADEAVPQAWSDSLVSALKDKDKSVEYYTYPGEDHNFDKGNWNDVMGKTLDFYNRMFSDNPTSPSGSLR